MGHHPLNLEPVTAPLVLDRNLSNDASCLLCPNCGDEHLHACTGEIQLIGPDDSRWKGGHIGVPFRCESCNADLHLEVGQHKGNTFLRWRVGVRA